jgi:hypothetical protein
MTHIQFYTYDFSYKKTSDVSSLRDKRNIDLTGSCVADLSVLKNVTRLTLSYCVNTDTDEPLNTDSPEYRMGYTFKLPQIQLLIYLIVVTFSLLTYPTQTYLTLHHYPTLTLYKCY